MNISLRAPRSALGLLTLLTALLCALALAPGSALADVSAPASQDFGPVAMGHTSDATVMVTVSNAGTTTFSPATLGGADPGQFSIVNDYCANSTFNGGGGCSIEVEFHPTADGAQTATLSVPSSDPASPTVVALSGVGQPLTLSSNAYFGNVLVGTAAQDVTVTVTNDMSQDLTSADPRQFQAGPSNPNPALQVVGGTCSAGYVVPAGGTCTVTFGYTPTAIETDYAEYAVDFNDSAGNPITGITIYVQGFGVGAPATSAAPADFGSVQIGQDSYRNVTVTNTGAGPLNISGATISGPDSDEFSLDGVGDALCRYQPVAPGGSCTISLQFAPTATGPQTAELDIASNDPASATTVALSGTGIQPLATPPSSGTGAAPSAPTGVSSAGGTTGASVPTLKATAAPASTVTFYVDGKAVGTATAAANGQASLTLSTPLAAGSHTVTATATDAAGNTSGLSTGYTFTVEAASAQPVQPVPPTQPTKAQPVQPTPPAHAKPQPTLVERVGSVGHPTARQLLTTGEKVRVYCSRACTLNVGLQVYYRAIARGTAYQHQMHAYLVSKPQPWTRVTVGQRTVNLARAGYKTITVKVSSHKQAVKDAGSILLGAYTRHGHTLVAKKWMQVKGPNMTAMVRALNRGR